MWVNLKSFMLSEEPDSKGCVLQDVIYLTFLQRRHSACRQEVLVVSCVHFLGLLLLAVLLL